MTDKTEVFVDVLMSVSLRDGVVRLDFGGFDRPPAKDSEGAGEAPDATPKHRLLMPVPVFVRSAGVMQEVVKRLEEERERRSGARRRDGQRSDGDDEGVGS